MAEKPIVFNTEMTRAILEDRKTQTRRLLRPRLTKNEVGWRVCIRKDTGEAYAVETYDDDERGQGYVPTPYQPGDVLWVRETWADIPDAEPGNYHYKASATDADLQWFRENGWKWRPSIHMPRSAARLFLQVTDVRIERLQDISPIDVKAEGIIIKEDDEFDVEMSQEAMERFEFERLWDSTIKPADLPKYGWEANPWVWRYTFERYTQGG